MNADDKVIFEFPVLWNGWELDNVAWVMERRDGTRYAVMTNHGEKREAAPEALRGRIAEYERALLDTQKALRLLGAEPLPEDPAH